MTGVSYENREFQHLRLVDRAGADLSMLPRSAQRRLKRVARSPFDSTVLVVGRDEADFKESLALHRQLVDLGIVPSASSPIGRR